MAPLRGAGSALRNLACIHSREHSERLQERRHPAGWLDGILLSDRGAAGCRPASHLEGGAPQFETTTPSRFTPSDHAPSLGECEETSNQTPPARSDEERLTRRREDAKKEAKRAVRLFLAPSLLACDFASHTKMQRPRSTDFLRVFAPSREPLTAVRQ